MTSPLIIGLQKGFKNSHVNNIQFAFTTDYAVFLWISMKICYHLCKLESDHLIWIVRTDASHLIRNDLRFMYIWMGPKRKHLLSIYLLNDTVEYIVATYFGLVLIPHRMNVGGFVIFFPNKLQNNTLIVCFSQYMCKHRLQDWRSKMSKKLKVDV